VTILGRASLLPQERETVILLGETGTGKTLIVKLASGIILPIRSSISGFCGKDISGMPESDSLEIRRQIGFVFQGRRPLRLPRSAENVAYRLHEDGGPLCRRRRNRAARKEVTQFRRHSPHKLTRFFPNSRGISFEGEGMACAASVSIADELIVGPPHRTYASSGTAGLNLSPRKPSSASSLRSREVVCDGRAAMRATQPCQDGVALVQVAVRAREAKNSDPFGLLLPEDRTQVAANSFISVPCGQARFILRETPDDFMTSNR